MVNVLQYWNHDVKSFALNRRQCIAQESRTVVDLVVSEVMTADMVDARALHHGYN